MHAAQLLTPLALVALLAASGSTSASQHDAIHRRALPGGGIHARAAFPLATPAPSGFQRRQIIGIPVQTESTIDISSAESASSASSASAASASSASAASAASASASAAAASASASLASVSSQLSAQSASMAAASLSSSAAAASSAYLSALSASQAAQASAISASLASQSSAFYATFKATVTSTAVLPSSTSSDSNSGGGGSSKTGIIVGVSVAGGIAAIVLGIFLWFKFGNKRFSGYDYDDSDIKWPELKADNDGTGAAMQPLPARRTGGAGFDMGDEASDDGRGAEDEKYANRNSYTGGSTAPVAAYGAYPAYDAGYGQPQQAYYENNAAYSHSHAHYTDPSSAGGAATYSDYPQQPVSGQYMDPHYAAHDQQHAFVDPYGRTAAPPGIAYDEYGNPRM